jgi:hypothetical protein
MLAPDKYTEDEKSKPKTIPVTGKNSDEKSL